MSVKLLINGIAGVGKTSLLSTLDKDTFVVSRDAKEFALPLPHMLVDTFYNMSIFCYGGEVNTPEGKVYVDGILDKLEIYNERFGSYPANVAIDSVSQIFMDVIDKASQTPNVYGSQGAEVTKEMSILTSFIHEQLELNGLNVILLNHVIEERADGKATGNYISFGSGKFLEKGGFFSTVNESVTITLSGDHRVVNLNGTKKLARTALKDLPEKMYVANTKAPEKSKKLSDGEEYFTLKTHLDRLLGEQNQVKEWSI